jgi:hypothetical protein
MKAKNSRGRGGGDAEYNRRARQHQTNFYNL